MFSGSSNSLFYHTYLSITTLPQDPQQLETLGPDVLRPLIDVVLRYLNLLTVVHVAAATHLKMLQHLFLFINRHKIMALKDTLNTHNSNPLH